MTKSRVILIIIISVICLGTMSLMGGCNKPIETFNHNYSLNIEYGEDNRQQIDIYSPADLIEEDDYRPVIVFIHGGSWGFGNKNRIFTYGKELLKFLDLGYIIVAMNYRLIPKVDYTEMLLDINSVMQFIVNNAEEYHMRSDKVAIAAFSAGAHLGMLYAYSELVEKPIEVALIMDFVGPTDFSDPEYLNPDNFFMYTGQRIIVNALSGAEKYNADMSDCWIYASPISYVSENSAPTIMAYGKKDKLVSYSNGERLYNKLQEKSVYSKIVTFPNSGHDLDKDPDKMEEMLEYCKEALIIYLPIDATQ